MKEERIYKLILDLMKKEYGECGVFEGTDEGAKISIDVEETEDRLEGYTITIEMHT